MSRPYVPLAEVARPHGVRGELRLKLYNTDSNLLETQRAVLLRMPDGSERNVTFATARPVNKGLLVRMPGVDDRDAADALRGAIVCVLRDAFPPLEEGEFYACDLEGARAVLADGQEIGKVVELRSYPTCDALAIERGDAGAIEVPLVEAYIASIDVEQKLVVVVSLDGLS